MGDIADQMVEGFLCQACGVMIDGEEPGYPRECTGCEETVPRRPTPKKRRQTNKLNEALINAAVESQKQIDKEALEQTERKFRQFRSTINHLTRVDIE